MAQTWQTVRVFISSTFRDIHSERDWLVKVVFPELRERLEKRRIRLVDIDLRWGVLPIADWETVAPMTVFHALVVGGNRVK